MFNMKKAIEVYLSEKNEPSDLRELELECISQGLNYYEQEINDDFFQLCYQSLKEGSLLAAKICLDLLTTQGYGQNYEEDFVIEVYQSAIDLTLRMETEDIATDHRLDFCIPILEKEYGCLYMKEKIEAFALSEVEDLAWDNKFEAITTLSLYLEGDLRQFWFDKASQMFMDHLDDEEFISLYLNDMARLIRMTSLFMNNDKKKTVEIFIDLAYQGWFGAMKLVSFHTLWQEHFNVDVAKLGTKYNLQECVFNMGTYHLLRENYLDGIYYLSKAEGTYRFPLLTCYFKLNRLDLAEQECCSIIGFSLPKNMILAVNDNGWLGLVDNEGNVSDYFDAFLPIAFLDFIYKKTGRAPLTKRKLYEIAEIEYEDM